MTDRFEIYLKQDYICKKCKKHFTSSTKSTQHIKKPITNEFCDNCYESTEADKEYSRKCKELARKIDARVEADKKRYFYTPSENDK